MKILLAEDDVELAGVTADGLQLCGHSVVVAHDGAQALRVWETAQPDLAVLDLTLPRVRGLDVLRAIRERAATPVILVSGWTGGETMLKGSAAGADDYMEKPFSVRVLAARIEAVARRSRSARPAEPPKTYAIGPLVLDIELHEVRR